VPTVLLLRHGRSTANAAGILAGRADGVDLDDRGLEQAAEAGRRLADIPVARVVCSPIARCRQTAQAAMAAAGWAADMVIDDRVSECDYGDWTGRSLAELAREGIWRTVQDRPSEVEFPAGETMVAMRDRIVEAVREHDAAVRESHGDHAVILVVSHGDPIKAAVSDVLGQSFDHFQRIMVDPGSITVVHYGPDRPFLVALNTVSGSLSGQVPQAPVRDAAVGGGAGSAADDEEDA
jgi:probable phosphomutase (TIGR03848 family)